MTPFFPSASPPRSAKVRAALCWGTVAVLTAAVVGAQERTPPQTKPNATVSDTRLGLENLELLQKGINPDVGTHTMTPNGLLVAPEMDDTSATVVLPEKSRDESTLRDLRRRQWASENWLLEGLRRGELAGDEAALTADTMTPEQRSEATENPTSARARLENGTSDGWLAMAVETQQEVENAGKDGPVKDSGATSGQGEDNPAPRPSANPLGDFMADWLSGDSRKVLATTADRSPGGGSFTPSAGQTQPDFGADSLDHLLGPLQGRTVDPVPASGNSTDTNPFLALRESESRFEASSLPSAFDLSALDPAKSQAPFQPEVMLPVPQSPASDASAVLPVDSPREKASEPWRPPAGDSEKYFPRLKRF